MIYRGKRGAIALHTPKLPTHLTELCAARQVKYLRGVGAGKRVFEGRTA